VPAAAKPLEDRTEIINGRVSANPLETLTDLQPNLQNAMISVRNAGGEVAAAARGISIALSNYQDQMPRVAQKAEIALDQFSSAMTNVNSIFDDPQMRADLKESLRELPQTLRTLDSSLNKANGAFDSMKLASDRAALNLANLENFTRPLGQRGPQLVDNLDGSLANINQLLEQLVTFTDNLNSREGTLGRILNDDAIYMRLERVLANAEDITARVKPVIGDIRVFSDKIARDPRQLGLKGALDRRPSNTGTKSLSPATSHHDFPISVEGDAYDPVVIP
jgi:phospholipid/cholesterol/gamma-HCH transport system substrate-binding protein